jgi:hypothetical protein
VQSLVQGEDERTDIIKKAQRLAVLRDEGAPSQLTWTEEAEVEEDHRLTACRNAVAEAKNNIQKEYGSLRSAPSDVNKSYASLKRRELNLRRELKRRKLEGIRELWFAEKQVTPEGLQGDRVCSDSTSFQKSLRIPQNTSGAGPQRIRIATCLFGYPDTIEYSAAIYDLVYLCSNCGTSKKSISTTFNMDKKEIPPGKTEHEYRRTTEPPNKENDSEEHGQKLPSYCRWDL